MERKEVLSLILVLLFSISLFTFSYSGRIPLSSYAEALKIKECASSASCSLFYQTANLFSQAFSLSFEQTILLLPIPLVILTALGFYFAVRILFSKTSALLSTLLLLVSYP
ncbi:MAG: hypothetical protein ABIH99_00865, partial [Candidatus Micrarchaeota archaeon]